MKNTKEVRHYSESFKLQIIQELEEGKYTKTEIIKLYNIGTGTLYNWIKKYGKLNLLNKRVRIETMSDINQIKRLELQVQELKEALVQRELKHLKTESYLQVAMDHLGMKDKSDFEKKSNAKLLKKQ